VPTMIVTTYNLYCAIGTSVKYLALVLSLVVLMEILRIEISKTSSDDVCEYVCPQRRIFLPISNNHEKNVSTDRSFDEEGFLSKNASIDVLACSSN